MKNAFAVVGVGLLLLAILVCGGIWSFGSDYAHRLYERTASPDAMVSSYEWYEQQVKDIKATEGQIADAQDALTRFKADNGLATGWRFDQRGEYDRLNSNLTGLKSARRSMVEAYNARAAMVTKNLWKSSTLPQHID